MLLRSPFPCVSIAGCSSFGALLTWSFFSRRWFSVPVFDLLSQCLSTSFLSMGSSCTPGFKCKFRACFNAVAKCRDRVSWQSFEKGSRCLSCEKTTTNTCILTFININCPAKPFRTPRSFGKHLLEPTNGFSDSIPTPEGQEAITALRKKKRK